MVADNGDLELVAENGGRKWWPKMVAENGGRKWWPKKRIDKRTGQRYIRYSWLEKCGIKGQRPFQSVYCVPIATSVVLRSLGLKSRSPYLWGDTGEHSLSPDRLRFLKFLMAQSRFRIVLVPVSDEKLERYSLVFL
ncbi:hypothetical protein PROH_13570 [Prochlorothrix hollandica PCC 9006 = CALU 1027]|uniref:Uncharacterized protein n=1 Tax=Prochlorothrix hollandica PCC 9006 = CALU 1027 TaxID=317619 RepID=A0A0M2PW38_PROHO|nr:hypothetical protein PROH_13570 [Prochlorothrix hollandica PCC 9006 = CALU 1027]